MGWHRGRRLLRRGVHVPPGTAGGLGFDRGRRAATVRAAIATRRVGAARTGWPHDLPAATHHRADCGRAVAHGRRCRARGLRVALRRGDSRAARARVGQYLHVPGIALRHGAARARRRARAHVDEHCRCRRRPVDESPVDPVDGHRRGELGDGRHRSLGCTRQHRPGLAPIGRLVARCTGQARRGGWNAGARAGRRPRLRPAGAQWCRTAGASSLSLLVFRAIPADAWRFLGNAVRRGGGAGA